MMEDKKLGAVEARFADLIWDNAPINSTALVRLCAKELDWKKSTTYRRPLLDLSRLSWQLLLPVSRCLRERLTRSRG